jgi:hypothetical protein
LEDIGESTDNGRDNIDLVIQLPFEERMCQLCQRENTGKFFALNLNDELKPLPV